VPGGRVARARVVSAGENGGHEVRVVRWGHVADGVDAVMHVVQTAVLTPTPYPIAVAAGREDLVPRDPAVLAGRFLSNDVE
jgi:hypothetical protein